MWKLKLIFFIAFVVALSMVGMVVSADNRQLIHPALFGRALPEASLGVWLFISLFTGGVLGFAIAWLSWIKSRGQILRLSRKLKLRDQELSQLRSTHLRE